MWPFFSELKVNLYQIELIVMLGSMLLQFISEFKEIGICYIKLYGPHLDITCMRKEKCKMSDR